MIIESLYKFINLFITCKDSAIYCFFTLLILLFNKIEAQISNLYLYRLTKVLL